MLANLLYNLSAVRKYILHGLRNLVSYWNLVIKSYPGFYDDAGKLHDEATARANKNHLSNFAKGLLAVYYEVYKRSSPSERTVIKECISHYLELTSEEVSFF